MANLRELIPAFFTGPNGQRLTPEQIAQRQGIAQSLMESAMDTSPTAGGWASVLAKGVQGYSAGRDRRLADRATEANATESQNAIAALLGGLGQSPSAPMAAQPSSMMPASGDASPQAASFSPSGNQLRDGILETAAAIGADPIDLATAISYETAGTFDPLKRGPTTQWGQHRGLIQFGEPQARQHGVDWNDPIGSQLGANGAVANYFRSSGFKPGMSGLDLYSTINAGAPGRYGASDANNGGAPGDVRDKWTNQMGDHRAKALALLGDVGAANNGVEAVNAMAFSQPQEAMAEPQTAPTQQAQAGGINPAIVQALSSPYVDSNTRSIAGMLLGNQLQQQQAEQERLRAEQAAQIRMQERTQAAQAAGVDPRYIGDDEIWKQAAGAQFREQPTDIREYEYARDQGYAGSFAQFQQEQKRAGATQLSVNTAGANDFFAGLSNAEGNSYQKILSSAPTAARTLGQLDQLEDLLSGVETGALAQWKQVAGNYGVNTEGLNEIQAASALINQMVPSQRPPGSGPMSDADLELFKQSVPRIINQPGGNDRIIQTMRAINRYDMELANVIQEGLAAAEATENPQDRALIRAEMRKKIGSLQNPLENFNTRVGKSNSSGNRTSSGVQWSID